MGLFSHMERHAKRLGVFYETKERLIFVPHVLYTLFSVELNKTETELTYICVFDG